MKRAVDCLPLLAMSGELGAARLRDAVILAAPSGFGFPPFGRHEALSLETMEDRVKHAIRPLEMAAGQLAHPFDNGVAVTVSFSEDREDERGGGSGHKIFTEFHTSQFYTWRFYVYQGHMHDGSSSDKRETWPNRKSSRTVASEKT